MEIRKLVHLQLLEIENFDSRYEFISQKKTLGNKLHNFRAYEIVYVEKFKWDFFF